MRMSMTLLALALLTLLTPAHVFPAQALAANGDYECRQRVWPQIQELRKRKDQVLKQVPSWGTGPQVDVGPCASRLRALDGNLLCCRTFANTASFWEEASCLELKVFYLEKACECGAQGSSYSTDDSVQDSFLKKYAEAKKLREVALNRGIANAVIREYLKRLQPAVDCINTNSVSLLNNAMKDLEQSIDNPQ